MTLDTILLIVLVLFCPVAWTMLVKKLPDILSKSILKEINHSYDKKLEELKGKIQADNTAIKSSVDLLATSQSELRSKIISSVESLWLRIKLIEETYSGALGATALMLPHEFDETVRGERPEAYELIKNYQDLKFFRRK